MAYIITPFFAWLMAGTIKFLINSIKEKDLAFRLIGYGGMPSNHSSIVSSTVVIIFLKEGIESPALAVAITLAFIVILDANSLRNKISQHAIRINAMSDNSLFGNKLRERVGHSKKEILGGIICGSITSFVIYFLETTL